MAYTLEVKYFNSFWIKSVEKIGAVIAWPGLPWNPTFINSEGDSISYTSGPIFPFGVAGAPGTPASGGQNFYIEEARIKGGFNNNIVSLGVRAYSINENSDQVDRSHSLIFSGVFNDRTGFNKTNVFSISENIIKDTDPLDGSIQRLYSEDSNIIVFQENKVGRLLVNKSTVYSGEQGAAEALGETKVLGQLVPYLGEYGISKNPESFGIFGYRKYFADKNRSAILRLSRDGITEISSYGMRDFFRENLIAISSDYNKMTISKTISTNPGIISSTFSVTSATVDIEIGSAIEIDNVATGSIVINAVDGGGGTIDITMDSSYDFTGTGNDADFITYRRGEIIGSYDIYNDNYTISLQDKPRKISTETDTFSTLSFDELTTGWTSFYSYKPVLIGSLKNKYYSFIDTNIYEHYYDNPPVYDTRCKFYGATIPDEANITFIFNPSPSITKNFNTIAYEGGNGWEVESFTSDFEGIDPNLPFTIAPFSYNDSNEYQDVSNSIKSYDEGKYIENGVYLHAGFNRKENRYVANIVSNSVARPGEVIFGGQVSGIKGYFTTIKFKVDSSTDPGGMKELFAVSSNYVMSSY